MSEPRIRDLVEVTEADTVVRLDGRGGRLQELVPTGDVTRSLATVLEAAQEERGAGFFVVGHFGSGKSHFLAAVGELLATSEVPEALRRQTVLHHLVERARRSLPVPVPLVEHRAASALEDVVWERAWTALGRPAEPFGGDRRVSWEALLAAAGPRFQGVALLLDEVSEFLRAKSGPALTEDLRFLQFLGEWARERPVLALCALQESIEEVASVSRRELARIRDRYPVTLGLSMRHVEDLVRGRLVRLKPGAEAEVERAHRELRAAFPRWRTGLDRFRTCYPVHPDTLELLGGLKFLLSQQRGVVDFVCRQLRGDAALDLDPWQDRGFLELLTPERAFDHFRTRLHERLESSRLADTVVPYYERVADATFTDGRDAQAGLRAVKLLTLLTASPLERPRRAAELAEMLLLRFSTVDPETNYAHFEEAVLGPLVAEGAYVVARPGPSGGASRGAPGAVYTIELEADASVVARARVEQERAELQPGDRRPLDLLVELGGSPTLPLGLVREQGLARREVLWQNTLRRVLLTAARLPEVGPEEARGWVSALDGARAEVCLVIAEPEPAGAAVDAGSAAPLGEDGRLALWAPEPLEPAESEFLVDLFCRRQVLRQARAEGRTEPGGLVEHLERGAEADAARAREILHRCYFQGRLLHPDPEVAVDLPALSGLPFDRVARGLAGAILDVLHPRHREVQPRGELVGDRLLRQLVGGPITAQRLTLATAERSQTRHLVEAYLLPLGAMRRRGDAFVVAPDPARSPAVAELLRAVPPGGRVRAGALAAGLSRGPFGLSEAETLLLLNAAVQAGVLEAHRGGRLLREPFLTLAEVDEVGPGELVAAGLRRLAPGLEAVLGPGPFEPWNVRVQESAWEHGRAWLEARREDAAQARAGLARLAEHPVLGASAAPEDDLRRLEGLLAAVDVEAGSRAGLEGLLEGLGEAGLGAPGGEAGDVVAAARRVGFLARFLRADLGRLEELVAYVTHPDLALPAGGYESLARLRAEVLELTPQVAALALEDRAGDVLDAGEAFRRAYGAIYAEEHAAFHDPGEVDLAAAVRGSPEYRALTALAACAPGGVPDDRVKVDRLLAAAAPAPCGRPLEAELRWKPACACGFRLGRARPRAVPGELVAVARRGVAQHLAELLRPGIADPMRRAASDLAALGREGDARDLSLLLDVAAAVEPDAVAVAHLVESVGPVLREVLGGGAVLARRDLRGLRDDLVARRFTRTRLLELLQAWVDQGGRVAAGGLLEVVDSGEVGAPGGSATAGPAGASGGSPASPGGTLGLLEARFPGLARRLPAEGGLEAFWLAAWWAGLPAGLGGGPAPGWLWAPLLEDPDELRRAAAALVEDATAREELGVLDGRAGAHTLLGDQLASALGLERRPAGEVAALLLGERLLRRPLRLAAGELLGRVAGDLELARLLAPEALGRMAAEHALVEPREAEALAHLGAAARGLRELELGLGGASCADLVSRVYPEAAPVPALLSRAGLAVAGPSLVGPTEVEALGGGARRLLRRADAELASWAAAGFPGCLPVWEVGRAVLGPLLDRHGRVAVLLVDAMRADLWLELRRGLSSLLGGRPLTQRWAVVPEPTRTAEVMAALALGRPVAAGSAAGAASGSAPGSGLGPASGPAREPGPPFAHLGFETRVVPVREDAASWRLVREAWAAGPPLTVVLATLVDERLHRSSAPLAELLDEAAGALVRHLVGTLDALPAGVPLVVLSDHGFREREAWSGGRGRYAHGGLSLEESVVPVAEFGAAG